MFKTILVAVDVNHSPSAKRVLSTASAIAGGGSEVHAVSVVPDMEMPIVAQYFPSDFNEKAHESTQAELESLIKADAPGAKPHVTTGRVYDKIVDTANKIGADLIVVGANAHGSEDYLVGSNARKVVAHAKQSVLVVRS